MSRLSVLTGQFYGKLDWVSNNAPEVGMYIRTSRNTSTRCVLRGPTVETMLTKGLAREGMMATASGTVFARCINRKMNNGDVNSEVVCDTDRLVTEDSTPVRVRGSIHANLKGVLMYWNAETYHAKTFFNFEIPGKPEKLVCSIFLGNWVDSMGPVSRGRFLAAMRVGREFTLSGVAESRGYADRNGSDVPVLSILPLDFKLQG